MVGLIPIVCNVFYNDDDDILICRARNSSGSSQIPLASSSTSSGSMRGRGAGESMNACAMETIKWRVCQSHPPTTGNIILSRILFPSRSGGLMSRNR